jgi:hypothetical protein
MGAKYLNPSIFFLQKKKWVFWKFLQDLTKNSNIGLKLKKLKDGYLKLTFFLSLGTFFQKWWNIMGYKWSSQKKKKKRKKKRKEKTCLGRGIKLNIIQNSYLSDVSLVVNTLKYPRK